MDITIDKGIKITVVPQYFPLKRRTGQLLKDFGLNKYQRKEVLDQITKFMHFNSHQHLLGMKAPSEPGTHNNGLRKSRSLGSINTIKQDLSTCPLPLTNTDSESDDDTPAPTPHTTIHTQPALDDSNQSHENGAVIININTVETESPKVQRLEAHIAELEDELKRMHPPIMSDYLKRRLKDSRKSFRQSYRTNTRSVSSLEQESINRQKESYDEERSEYFKKRNDTTEELIRAKEEVRDLKSRLHKECIKSKKLKLNNEGLGHGNTEPPAVEIRSTPAVIVNENNAFGIAKSIFEREYTLEQKQEFAEETSKHTDYDSFRVRSPYTVFHKWSEASKLFRRKTNYRENPEFKDPKVEREYFFQQCLEHSKNV